MTDWGGMAVTVIHWVRSRSFAERYLATAAFVWLVYGSLSAALLHTGLATWLAGGLAYAVALVLHFSLHRFVVFRKDELDYHHDLTTQVRRYLTTAAVQYAFTLAGTAFLVERADLHRAPAYVGCAAFAAVLNFLALKFLVFRHQDDEPPAPTPALRAPSSVDEQREPVGARR